MFYFDCVQLVIGWRVHVNQHIKYKWEGVQSSTISTVQSKQNKSLKKTRQRQSDLNYGEQLIGQILWRHSVYIVIGLNMSYLGVNRDIGTYVHRNKLCLT